jgi:hypothetical protein
MRAEAEARVDSIRLDRELKQAEVHWASALSNGDIPQLQSLAKKYYSGGLWDKEMARLRLEGAIETTYGDVAIRTALANPDQEAALASLDKINADVKEEYPFIEGDLYGPDEIAGLKDRYQGAVADAATQRKRAEREAAEARFTENMKVLVQDDFDTALANVQKDLLAGRITGDEATDQSNKLRNAAIIFADTGVNAYKVTQNHTKYNQLREDIIARRLADPAIVWQAVGPNGISDPDAQRLQKMIPTGGTAKDFEDTKAARTFLELFDESAIGASGLVKEKALAKEEGLRRLEKTLIEYPDMTEREKREAALRVAFDIEAESMEGTLPKQLSELTKIKKPLTPGDEVTSGGEVIGVVDKDGALILNRAGLERLKRITQGNKERAREIIKERGWKVGTE